MRVAYASDLHGNLELYHALLALAVQSQAEAVVVGGDLLPHEPRRGHAVASQRRFITDDLRPLLRDFRAYSPGVAVFLLAGNDDWASAIAALDDLERARLALPLHGRAYPLAAGGLSIAGYACVPPTPFSMKDYERPDDGSRRAASFGQAYVSAGDSLAPISAAVFDTWPTIAAELGELADQVDPKRTIFVCHTPPANTPLDQMRGDRHVGSPGLRAFIERHTPPLTLHGHIHESPSLSGRYACQIGPTWCVNAGRDPERLHAVTFDTDDIAGTLTHTVYGRPAQAG